MENVNGTLVNPSGIARAWGMDSRDATIKRFLDLKGINPVQTYKFGRGTMRLYRDDVLNLRGDFLRHLEQVRIEAAARFAHNMGNVAGKVAAKRNRIEERLAMIEMKLDRLLAKP